MLNNLKHINEELHYDIKQYFALEVVLYAFIE